MTSGRLKKKKKIERKQSGKINIKDPTEEDGI